MLADRQMRNLYHVLSLLLFCFFLRNGLAQQNSGWKLVWSDEFNGPAGAAPDSSKWKFQAGAGATIAGNEEAEMYCGTCVSGALPRRPAKRLPRWQRPP